MKFVFIHLMIKLAMLNEMRACLRPKELNFDGLTLNDAENVCVCCQWIPKKIMVLRCSCNYWGLLIVLFILNFVGWILMTWIPFVSLVVFWIWIAVESLFPRGLKGIIFSKRICMKMSFSGIRFKHFSCSSRCFWNVFANLS